MKEIKKQLKLDNDEYYETHLSLVNCLLPEAVKMTPKEICVMARFMSLKGDIAIQRFGPTAKKIVKENLKLSAAGLSNYMSSLTIKGLLIKKGDLIEISPILFPEPDEQIYMFKLVNFGEPLKTV